MNLFFENRKHGRVAPPHDGLGEVVLPELVECVVTGGDVAEGKGVGEGEEGEDGGAASKSERREQARCGQSVTNLMKKLVNKKLESSKKMLF